jgi:hypothetical protein
VPQISQSTILVGATLAAFVLWLAMQNRLAAYWALLTGGGAGSTGTVAAPGALAKPPSPGGFETGMPPGSTGIPYFSAPGTGIPAPGTSGGVTAPTPNYADPNAIWNIPLNSGL